MWSHVTWGKRYSGWTLVDQEMLRVVVIGGLLYDTIWRDMYVLSSRGKPGIVSVCSL